jgi:hypothetical protein
MAERRTIAIDPEIAGLLAQERGRPDPPVGTKSSVRTRLQASIVGIAALGEPTSVAPDPSSAPTHAPHWFASKFLWAGLSSLAVLSGGYLAARTGRWDHRRPVGVQTREPESSPAPAPVGQEMPAATPEPIVPAPTDHLMAVPAKPGAHRRTLTPTTAVPSPEESAVPADALLRREQEMVRRARVALRTGDTAQALQLLSQHAQEFPLGRLAEERYGLQVRALLEAGDERGARERLTEMSGRFPESPLLPGLQQALGDHP